MPSDPPDPRRLKPPGDPRPPNLDATGVHDSGELSDTSLPGSIGDIYGFKNVPGYEVEAVLGSGACGIVFRAKQLKLDRTVALKTISLDSAGSGNLMARFEKEAVALARLQHPHIVNVFDSGRHEGRLFFAMEMLVGRDLGEHIDRFGALDERQAWSIARQTATALAHAAKADIIHRDVKPANLFLVTPPTGYPLPPGVPMVKVTDFGLALNTGAASQSGDTRLTHVGTVVGTPIYMAPEQFTKQDIDSRADIYSLGATVHHMLTGTAPFDGKSIWDVLSKKNDPVPPPLGGRISRASAELVAAMMQPKPEHRIGSYLELLGRIDELLNEFDPARTVVIQRQPVVSRRLGMLLAGIALAIAIAAVPIWLVARKQNPEADRTTVAVAPAGRYIGEGKSLTLFNNENIANWTIGGGKWGVEDDAVEGGVKIAGSGNLKTGFDRKPPFRIAIGLALRDPNTTAEILVCKSRGPAERAEFYTVRIRRSGVQLGRKTGERGAWEPTGVTVAYPTAEQLGDSSPYLPVEIEALGDRWHAKFQAFELGAIPDDGTLGLTEVNFAVSGGALRIESVILEGLKRVE